MRRLFPQILNSLSLVALGTAVVSLAGPPAYSTDILASILVYQCGAAIFGAGLSVLLAARRGVVGFLITAILLAGAILPIYKKRAPAAEPRHPIALLWANLNITNKKAFYFTDLVGARQPDIIGVCELNYDMARKIDFLKLSYPYHLIHKRTDTFSIALFSRLPLSNVGVSHIGEAHPVPVIMANVEIASSSVRLILAHLDSPTSRRELNRRNEQLSDLAALCRSQSPTIMVGDLNTSTWSPYFRRLLRESGLIEARQGFGVEPSWHAQKRWLRIPIDHCLVSPAIDVMYYRRGPDVYSDHYPLLVRLGVPATNATPAAGIEGAANSQGRRPAPEALASPR